MLPKSSGPDRFHPQPKGEKPADSRAGWSLTPRLRQQINQRLQLIAVTYSLAFFVSDFVTPTLAGQLHELLADPRVWLPGVIGILAGFAVAVLASLDSLSWRAKIDLGLGFEVVGSYVIALAQYLDTTAIREHPVLIHVLSPSWVGIWIIFFSAVVPTPPRRTIAALILSASAPLVVIWTSLRVAQLGYLATPIMMLLMHALPYAICAGMAYLASRVVHNLGTEVARATELGSYRLIERLGRGGMGEVWKATHEMLARPAAIKFIRPEAIAGVNAADSQLILRRFELEARSTAALTSVHTVNLYDFGATEDGDFYYVMELLDGLDCEELVRRFGPIPPARAAHLLRQICESLEEAHAKGLIHRDVKPANIYVCRSGLHTDFIKVLDFGLVAHSSPPTQDLRLTQPDQTIGTPQYMPPEVALGQTVDARADIYALGCVAYWLTTGRPVFEGDNFYEVVSRHLHAAPDPPSHHAPGLPPEWDALVLACLEKDPAQRPQSAHELEIRLRDLPLADCWQDEQADAWWARHLPTGS